MAHGFRCWLAARGVALSFVALCWVSPGAARATEFVRGDANNDGVVSFADAEAILSYLFRFGEEISCGKAADANDSGQHGVDIADAAAVWSLIFGDIDSLPAPYPNAGEDPTPDDENFYPPGCGSYGGRSVLEDNLSRLEIVDAYANGGDDGAAYIVVAMANTLRTSAFAAFLRFPAGLVTSVSRDGSGSLIPENYVITNLRDDEVMFLWTGPTQTGGDLSPSPLTPVVELRLCLAQGTPADDYPIELSYGELVEHGTSRSIRPAIAGGVLHVLADVAVDQDCSNTTPPPPPPEAINAECELVGGVGVPGGEVDVAFKIKADLEVQGFAASIDFDEEILQALSVERVWQKPDGSDYSFFIFEHSNINATPGNGGIDEGFLIAVGIFDFVRPIGIPANASTEVLRFRMRVHPEATATATELRFLNGAQGRGTPVHNQVTANGGIDYTEDSAESFLFLNGLIGVSPDIITFLRGDSNGDAAVDLSDAQTTLSALFLGGASVACYDAADANDDSTINIADPVYTLQFLFLGGSEPPPPFPGPGSDPTADTMGCLVRS